MTRRTHPKRSSWPYLSLLPFGLGAWASIWAGARLQRRGWIAWGLLWTLLAVAGWVVAIASNGGAGGGLLIIAGWAGGAATAFGVRRAYDETMASPFEHAAEASAGRLAERERARDIAQRNPALAREMGVGRPDRPGAADGGLVDVNNASVTALLRLPGIDGDLATEICECREKVGGFASLEDLGETLDIDGGVVEGLRDRVVFLPRGA